MNKLKEILISYAIKHNPTEEQQKVAEKRLEICMGCEHWRQTAIRDYCNKCGCTTSVKIYTPVGSSACPEKRWAI
jgi:hypothetical protein